MNKAEIRYFTIKEIAQLLSVSRSTVRREIARGLLPAVQVGCQYRIGKSAVDAYLERSAS